MQLTIKSSITSAISEIKFATIIYEDKNITQIKDKNGKRHELFNSDIILITKD